MPFCEKSGASVKPHSNFCPNCGTPQNAQPQPQPNFPPMPPPPNNNNSTRESIEPPAFQSPPLQKAAEQIIDFIIIGKSKRFGGQEYFTGILTTTQLIIAPMTKDMLKEVTNISRQQAKNNNTTFTGTYPYQQMNLNNPPSTILSQTPGSFSIQNSASREITLKLVNNVGDGYSDFQEYELQIITDPHTFTFHMTKRDEYVTRLKQVYKEKVRLH
jgi:hypothetical protein